MDSSKENIRHILQARGPMVTRNFYLVYSVPVLISKKQHALEDQLSKMSIKQWKPSSSTVMFWLFRSWTLHNIRFFSKIPDTNTIKHLQSVWWYWQGIIYVEVLIRACAVNNGIVWRKQSPKNGQLWPIRQNVCFIITTPDHTHNENDSSKAPGTWLGGS